MWLDIPVHVLGGITVALGISILPFFKISLPKKYATLFAYVGTAVMVGIAWEIFEVASSVAVVDDGYVIDTVIDLCMDALGGALGYGIVQSIQRL